MKSTRFIGNAADRTSGVYNLSEINEKIQDQTYPTNYEIENSLRFDGSSYLSRPFTAGNRRTHTLSFWLKKSENVDSAHRYFFDVTVDSSNYAQMYFYDNQLVSTDYTSGNDGNLHTNRKFRDVSAWYHIVLVNNLTSSTNTLTGTSTDRIQLYVNGVQETSFLGFNIPAINSTTYINSANTHIIGWNTANTAGKAFSGYMADIHFVDGSALDPTHFAHSHPSTGRWSPKRYRGTYGNNGFHLEFKNTGTHTGVGGIGEDTSGNANHWAVTGLTVHDIVPDSPGNNFVTWNPVSKSGGTTTTLHTIAQGALQLTHITNAAWQALSATFGASTGKFYYEIYTISISNTTNDHGFGFVTQEDIDEKLYYGESKTVLYTLDGGTSSIAIGVGGTSDSGIGRQAVASSMPKPTNGDTMQCVIDLDKRTVQFGLNGTFYETANIHFDYTTMIPVFSSYKYQNNATAADIVANFGQDPTFSGNKTVTKSYTDANNRGQFYYPPPAGALALCEKNLVQPQDSVSEYRVDDTDTKALTYTGNVEISKFTPYAQDGYSIYLPESTSDYLTVSHNAVLNLPANFTIDFWLYAIQVPHSSYYNMVVHKWGADADKEFVIQYEADGKLKFTVASNNTGTYNTHATSAGRIQFNTKWQHVAIVGDITNTAITKIYIDGVLDSSKIDWPMPYYNSSTANLRFGEYGSSTNYTDNHYISDFRIIKGTQLYSGSSYTVPTAPVSTTDNSPSLVLSTNSKTFKDSSANNLTVTLTGAPSIEAFSPYTPKDSVPDHSVHGGSFYFNDSNKRIEFNYANAISSQDYRMEFWVNLEYKSGKTYSHLFDQREDSDDTSGYGMCCNFQWYTDDGIYAKIYFLRGTDQSIANTTKLRPNQWHHIVLIRSYAAFFKVYIDTVEQTSWSSETAKNGYWGQIGFGRTLQPIGYTATDTSLYYIGYLADVKIDVGNSGTDLNAPTANPTSKKSTDANTKLLLQPYHTAPAHGALETLDAYNTDETGKQITYHKQANVVSANPFTDVKIGSVSIGGAVGDGIEIPSTTDFTFSTGEFTVEMWVRPTNTTSAIGRRTLISHRNANQSGTDTTQWAWFINDNNFEVHDIGAIKVSGGGEFGSSGSSLNKWHHVVWCRDSTSMRFYVNGILKTTIAYASYNPNYSTDRQLIIGSDTLVDSTLDGFITDVRIVKGQALYVNAFTTPAYPLSSTHYTTDGTDPTTSSTKQTISGTVSLFLQPGKTTSNTLAAENPEKFYKAITFDGTGQTQAISGLAFQPDLVWMKNRDTAQSHALVDSVRTRSKVLFSDSTGAQQTSGSTEDLISFDSNGFSVGTPARAGSTNNSGSSIVAWSWRAGGAPSADGKAMIDGVEKTITGDAILDAGTITPTKISANTRAGFSIVKYTSPNDSSDQTVPHGLSSSPNWIIIKNLDNTYNWDIYHSSVSNSGIFTTAAIDSRSAFGTVNNNIFTTKINFTHYSTNNYIAYCWHSVPGYSAFGNYTGVVSGKPFIYTGFKPAWVMIKGTDVAYSGSTNLGSYQGWSIFDTARDDYNPSKLPLYANAAYSEGLAGNGSGTAGASVGGIDIVSNGFRILDGSASYSGIANINHIYIAFAEQPFTRNRAR